jgi:hypothetical protein
MSTGVRFEICFSPRKERVLVNRIIFLIFISAAAFSMSAVAQDVTGDWIGRMRSEKFAPQPTEKRQHKDDRQGLLEPSRRLIAAGRLERRRVSGFDCSDKRDKCCPRLGTGYHMLISTGGSRSQTRQNSSISGRVPKETRM